MRSECVCIYIFKHFNFFLGVLFRFKVFRARNFIHEIFIYFPKTVLLIYFTLFSLNGFITRPLF